MTSCSPAMITSSRGPESPTHLERAQQAVRLTTIYAVVSTHMVKPPQVAFDGHPARDEGCDGDLIGYCGLIVGRATWEEPEIAFELFRRVHGSGYATEAGEAVVAAAIQSGRDASGRLSAHGRAVLSRLAETAVPLQRQDNP